MPMQHGEDAKTSLHPGQDGPKGIENKNESLERPDAMKMTGAVRQGAINKLEAKLRQEHPDWADDKVQTVATRMFEMATSKPTGKASNEGNEDERGPENEMKTAAPPPEHHLDTGTTGVSTTPKPPKGLSA